MATGKEKLRSRLELNKEFKGLLKDFKERLKEDEIYVKEGQYVPLLTAYFEIAKAIELPKKQLYMGYDCYIVFLTSLLQAIEDSDEGSDNS